MRLDLLAAIRHKWENVEKLDLDVESPCKFMGAWHRTLDNKGRLLLPSRFLDALRANNENGSFWLTSLYGRLTAYLPNHWDDIVRSLCEIKIPSRKLSNFKTRLIGMSCEMVPDAQGRIRIPQPLMREGNLRKDIVLVGVMDKFEIWDQANFEAVPNEDVSDELVANGVDIIL